MNEPCQAVRSEPQVCPRWYERFHNSMRLLLSLCSSVARQKRRGDIRRPRNEESRQPPDLFGVSYSSQTILGVCTQSRQKRIGANYHVLRGESLSRTFATTQSAPQPQIVAIPARQASFALASCSATTPSISLSSIHPLTLAIQSSNASPPPSISSRLLPSQPLRWSETRF